MARVREAIADPRSAPAERRRSRLRERKPNFPLAAPVSVNLHSPFSRSLRNRGRRKTFDANSSAQPNHLLTILINHAAMRGGCFLVNGILTLCRLRIPV